MKIQHPSPKWEEITPSDVLADMRRWWDCMAQAGYPVIETPAGKIMLLPGAQGENRPSPRVVAHDRATRVLGPRAGRWK